LQILTKALQNALYCSDVVLLTGGISVGDYDFVLQAATNCGVIPLFYKVRQRPGKPLFLGKMQDKLVFGLPGNPSSVLTCFYIHVIPALEMLCNRNMSLQTVHVPLGSSYQKAAGLTHFLKGTFDGHTASLLGAQESYRMRSFAQSNCLIQIDEETTVCNEGELVKVHLLPH
jgi:molybdopterin molybdotransferase